METQTETPKNILNIAKWNSDS